MVSLQTPVDVPFSFLGRRLLCLAVCDIAGGDRSDDRESLSSRYFAGTLVLVSACTKIVSDGRSSSIVTAFSGAWVDCRSAVIYESVKFIFTAVMRSLSQPNRSCTRFNTSPDRTIHVFQIRRRVHRSLYNIHWYVSVARPDKLDSPVLGSD